MRLVIAEHELMTGEVNVLELRRVLRDRLKAGPALLGTVESLLREHAVVPKPRAPSTRDIRDADDAWVLASAVVGGADMLVTGDRDLLVVARRAPLPIVAPREAWIQLRER